VETLVDQEDLLLGPDPAHAFLQHARREEPLERAHVLEERLREAAAILAPELVLAVMAVESNFDPLAVSPKNAQGLMQLTPDTAARFRVRPLTDPVQNIRGGMAYLRWLLAYFEGDLALVLAAYNAGERAVERYRGVPPYLETRLYVSTIIAALGGQRSYAFDPSVTPPSNVLALLRTSQRPR